ncbi:extracellular solute-binding protein [Allonocardiopsis opalescens]|uniref:Carbohydrate ABC transporter substrate-binding protein (CUT1 family) n=1 Tax=Allonocardiopsis opalescens TaxID=1144618 RepID=A0A2T0Q204_9ACTN|nr:extracellular solute-binding protein [Allonocardiopsis opalescens]PRX97809.1 carbohydrate ABC transporter substrate-binding protein (CUT1 family) [Allonocardiopsis opalescens]
MRFIRLGGALAATALAISACGGADQSGASGGAVDPEDVSGEITFWDTSDATNEAPAFQALVEDFQAEYPNITVNYETVPFDGAQDTYRTAAQAGDAPDVLRAEVAWVPEFASLGYLAPLDGTPALQDPDDFLETPFSSTRYEGATYAVPQVTDGLALLYNRELLAEAGYDEPPQTMEQLREVALAVSEETDAEGLYLNVGAGYYLLPHIYGQGGDLLDVEGQRITVNSPEAVAGLEEVLDLIESGAAAEPELGPDTYDNMQTAFKEGLVAMVINGPWAMADNFTGPEFEDPENLGVAPVPAGPAGQGSPVGGHNYAVYAGSQNLDASYLFVQYMASAESQARIAAELGLLPTRASAYELPEVAENPVVADFLPVVEGARPRAWIPEGGQLFTPLDLQYAEAVAGQASPQEALDAVADEYRTFLQDWE